MTAQTPTSVTVFVDPICPFAWITSRWLLEVELVRPVTVTFGVMSLSVLNEGRDDLSEFYAELIGTGWPPVRVASAVERYGGPSALKSFYNEFGRRHHVDREEPSSTIIAAALHSVGLPSGLVTLADSPEFDDMVRAGHRAAAAAVGDEVGTPVLHVEHQGARWAIFGPVLAECPRGERAGRLWDATLTLASDPDFFELKRTRTRQLVTR